MVVFYNETARERRVRLKGFGIRENTKLGRMREDESQNALRVIDADYIQHLKAVGKLAEARELIRAFRRNCDQQQNQDFTEIKEQSNAKTLIKLKRKCSKCNIAFDGIGFFEGKKRYCVDCFGKQPIETID